MWAIINFQKYFTTHEYLSKVFSEPCPIVNTYCTVPERISNKRGHERMGKAFDFQKFKTIRSFGIEIYNNDLSSDDAIEQQIRLQNDIDIF